MAIALDAQEVRRMIYLPLNPRDSYPLVYMLYLPLNGTSEYDELSSCD